jgi:hypothetical protein
MFRTTRLLRLAPIGLAALWLVGCGGGSSPAVQTLQRSPAPKFKVTVATDKATYHTGDPIAITVTVTNTDTVAHSLTYPNGGSITKWGYLIAQGTNIIAYEYWPGHNINFTQVLTTDTYAAGETMTFDYTFPYLPSGATPGPVTSLPAGTYQVYARQSDLTYDGATAIRYSTPTPASDPVQITVQ